MDGKDDSKRIRVDAKRFENGKNKISFSNKNVYVWTGPYFKLGT